MFGAPWYYGGGMGISISIIKLALLTVLPFFFFFLSREFLVLLTETEGHLVTYQSQDSSVDW